MVLLASACRTVGHLKLHPTPPETDRAVYRMVVVRDFAVQLAENQTGAERSGRLTKEAEFAARRLTDRVEAYLQRRGAFAEVARGTTNPPRALIVEGTVTRAVAGDTETRFREGTGLGSAYLEAVLTVHDSSTGERVATLMIDRQSWPGGGLFAADETLGSFLDQEARKFARQLSVAFGVGDPDSPTAR